MLIKNIFFAIMDIHIHSYGMAMNMQNDEWKKVIFNLSAWYQKSHINLDFSPIPNIQNIILFQ